MCRFRGLLIWMAICCTGGAAGCGGSHTTSPTPVVSSVAPVSGSTPVSFTVIGKVTGYRKGPIAGARVRSAASPIGGPQLSEAITESDGTFHLPITASRVVDLDVTAAGYFSTAKLGLADVDQAADFVLEPLVEAGPGNDISVAVGGDLVLNREYPYNGLIICKALPCKRISLKCCASPLRVRLEWDDPSVELALYLVKDPYYPPTAARYCCTSPIEADYAMNYDFDVAFVAFERKNGSTPSPDDLIHATFHVERAQ
jgi:hypothetical protein